MNHSQKTGAVILAAGKGTRMHSDSPKVLQRILEEPMLACVYDATDPVCDTVLTVVGHRADMIEAAFPDRAESFVLQKEQLGTGHALQQAWPDVQRAGLSHVLIINGDTPLLQRTVLEEFLQDSLSADADVAFVTLTLDDPAAFGRVVRKNGEVAAIIEAKDYDPALHGPEPREINAGIYCLKVAAVTDLLPLLQNSNKSGEFYITDIIGLAVEKHLRVRGCSRGSDLTLLGINSPSELVRSEEILRAAIVEECLNKGVIVRAADSVRISPKAVVEPGVEITGPCEIYGNSHISRGARIASHCRFNNARVLEGALVHSYSHVEDAQIGVNAIVGPFARLRPGAVLEESAHVGNFVEMKKARLGKGAKANHLTYLGDADVGAGANIGAGTITCNYDGVNKHQTVIGEKAFIGSNSSLVAPVVIGNGALIGAGSTITKPVADGMLALTRAPQKSLPKSKK